MKKIKNTTKTGFTLIELLVVIAVISFMASVVLVATNTARQKAKVAKLAADVHQIMIEMEVARDRDNKVLRLITMVGCTACDFSNSTKAITQSSALGTNWLSWTRLGLVDQPVDPWGTPYTMDENEDERLGHGCIKDDVISAGPDGIVWTSDDYIFEVPFFFCTS